MSQLEEIGSERIDVDSALQHAGRHESRRTVSWLLATAIVAVAVELVIRDAAVTGFVAALGVALTVWSLRLKWGVTLAMRDFRKALTPPRCAYVVLLEDVNPRALRALLAIWSMKPEAGERLPKPDRVFRCDDELEELKSFPGDVVVHEAWVDTGPRPSSKPRWIAADAGISVPHRRAVLGRWYVSVLMRHDRPAPPRPLTIGAPTPAAVPVVERAPLEGSLLGEVGWRCVLLSALAVLATWLS
ncbi:MAG TPA: hypothetical protein VK585_10700 [Jiangellaceae bacterium]|nr:hypothetical protein [Jiangellaceae bacterium]